MRCRAHVGHPFASSRAARFSRIRRQVVLVGGLVAEPLDRVEHRGRDADVVGQGLGHSRADQALGEHGGDARRSRSAPGAGPGRPGSARRRGRGRRSPRPSGRTVRGSRTRRGRPRPCRAAQPCSPCVVVLVELRRGRRRSACGVGRVRRRRASGSTFASCVGDRLGQRRPSAAGPARSAGRPRRRPRSSPSGRPRRRRRAPRPRRPRSTASSTAGWNPCSSTTRSASATSAVVLMSSSRSCGSLPGWVRFVTRHVVPADPLARRTPAGRTPPPPSTFPSAAVSSENAAQPRRSPSSRASDEQRVA